MKSINDLTITMNNNKITVRAGGAIWANPFATVLFLYPCCVGVFGMLAVM